MGIKYLNILYVDNCMYFCNKNLYNQIFLFDFYLLERHKNRIILSIKEMQVIIPKKDKILPDRFRFGKIKQTIDAR